MGRSAGMRARVLVSIAGLVAVFTAAVAVAEYRKYAKFRASPDWRVFAQEMASPGLLSPIARYMLFKPGSEVYHEQLAHWLESMKVKSAPRDKSNFHDFLESLDPTQLALLSRSFSQHPEVLLPHVKEKLFPAHQPCYFSKLSTDDEDSYLLLQPDEDEEVWGIPYEEINDSDLRARVRGCIASLGADASSYFPVSLLPQQGADADTALQSLQERKNFLLMARIVASKSKLSSASATWLADNLKEANESVLSEVQYLTEKNEVVQSAFFNHWRIEDEQSAIEPLRQLIIAGHTRAAQNVARDVIAARDSSFRKDVIVVLARNSLPLGQRNIDEAFVGPAPRREKFHSHSDYVRSKTALAYSDLARHEYVQTGKSFPTTYCKQPQTDEVEKLRAFIGAYPWFPGADDAHLRLVSRLLLDGMPHEAASELERLEATEYPDTDAKEYADAARVLIAKAIAGTYNPPTPDQWHDETATLRCSRKQGDGA